MSGIIILTLALVFLFVLAFLTKRRFGVLGLALGAGSILSTLWAEKLTPLVEKAGVVVNQPPLLTLVSITLVLLPALVLLVGGPRYHGMVARLVGASCFAILALALLVEPLGNSLILSGNERKVYQFFADNQVYIVTIGLIISIGDLIGSQGSPLRRQRHHE